MKRPQKPKKLGNPKSNGSPSANLDLDPEAWPKFEALVKSAAKMGHKPHGKRKAETAKK
jgi:hypothetical protein